MQLKNKRINEQMEWNRLRKFSLTSFQVGARDGRTLFNSSWKSSIAVIQYNRLQKEINTRGSMQEFYSCHFMIIIVFFLITIIFEISFFNTLVHVTVLFDYTLKCYRGPSPYYPVWIARAGGKKLTIYKFKASLVIVLETLQCSRDHA